MNSQHELGTTAIGLQALAVALLIGFSSWLTIDLTRPAGGVTIIWVASGLLAGILLTSPHRVWPAYVIAALAGNLIARAAYGDPLLVVVARGVASTLEACIVAFALRYFVGNVNDPAKLRLVARVAMSSTLLACAISALIAAATSSALGNASFTATLTAWFTSHTLGIVVFATVVGIARELGTSVFGRPGHRWKFARSMALVVVTTLWVFTRPHYPLLFLIYPPMLLAVIRHHFAGLAIGITLVVVISLIATTGGFGPITRIDLEPSQRALVLQVFFASTCLTTLPVAIMLAERGRLAAKLRENQDRLRAITDNLPAMVMHVDAEQKYTFVNAYLAKVFGLEPTSMIGRTLREVVDEKLYANIKPHVEAALRGERVTFEGEIEADGKRFFRQANYIPDVAADGSVRGFYSLTYDLTEIQAAKQELLHIAQHDSLTGLGNRNKFNERLTLALAKCHRHGHPIALLYLDIDHFKEINDRFGHAVGDAVLCEFAKRMQANLREVDLLARLGGDEFAVLIEDIDSVDVPEIIARKLIAAMHHSIVVDSAELQITTSIGIGFARTAPNADVLMKAADDGLYAAKTGGRNTYRVVVLEAT